MAKRDTVRVRVCGLLTRPVRDASKRESWRVQNNGLSAPTNVELNPPPADSTTVPVVVVS